MSLLDDSVTSPDDGETFDFRCPGIRDSVCGDTETGVPFVSTGWPTREVAAARGREHFDDHLGIRPTSSLDEFRAKHGLAPTDDGLRAVRLEDIQ